MYAEIFQTELYYKESKQKHECKNSHKNVSPSFALVREVANVV